MDREIVIDLGWEPPPIGSRGRIVAIPIGEN